VALYGAYADDVNLDSSALKDAAVDCSTTWDGSEFQSFTVRTAKEWRNACVEEPTFRPLTGRFAPSVDFSPPLVSCNFHNVLLRQLTVTCVTQIPGGSSSISQ